MRWTFIYCAALEALFSNLSHAVTFKLSNLVCESYNKSWFLFHDCRLKAISREKVIMNLNGTVLYPANNIRTDVKVLKRESGYKPWVLNTKVDSCRFLQKSNNPIATLIYRLFKEFTNINHTCPYVGPQIIRGFYLKPELLMLPLPTGEYMLSLRWFFDQKLQFDTNVSFVFVEDNFG